MNKSLQINSRTSHEVVEIVLIVQLIQSKLNEGGYGKWVKSKSKCATTLGVSTGPLLAIWLQK